MPLPVLLISIVLFFVLFFGIGFLLNMLFRSSWVMVILFPIVAILIVNQSKMIEYVRQPIESLKQLGLNFAALHMADIIILSSGLLGGVCAGITIKLLRKKGYQMF
ncbi:YuiB family protein [Peribacillus asahii]|uniref:Membrane protein n=1 Tax=Peribacillus asahii TaxID=228899 RepID=A0A3T0KXI2_9BACI|nr:YuiB family protein [Peribacillus asahii]AZV45044.1 membrane protein [Peribacillus asahii]USK84661.1 YuiB family protein [Peribacillus asahii]